MTNPNKLPPNLSTINNKIHLCQCVRWITYVWISLFLYVPCYTYPHMTYELSEIETGRLRIIVTHNDKEVVILYFEKAKNSFQNKPISMDAWGCVDAKIEGLYDMVGDIEVPTPREVIKTCQELIKEKGY